MKMRHAARIASLGALASAALFVCAWAPAAQAFSVSKWEAGTCKETSCKDSGSHEAFYTQAAGHPDFGITDFEFNFKEAGLTKAKEPEGNVKDVRVDLPPGLAVNPEATGTCTEAQLDEFKCPAESKVGEDEATGTAELVLGIKSTVEEKFPVYNMVRKSGEPARFGVEINSSTLKTAESVTGHHLVSELYLEGGISWHQEAETSESSGVKTGDYHEFFKIQSIPTEPEVVESRLVFWGVPHEHNAAAPNKTFLTMPSAASDCADKQITYLHVDSYSNPGQFVKYANETPVTATGCNTLAFSPSLALANGAGEEAPDRVDGPEVALHIPQSTSDPSKLNSPDLKTAQVTLPEGMTLNPSAANGLQACANEQIAIGTNNLIGCPEASKLGTFTVDAPGIPNNTLNGTIYLATQENQEPESGGEFRFFLAGEAPEYGVGVRLEGRVSANSHTGQLTATVNDGPEVPFENFILHFRGGPRAPLANPLLCAPTPLSSLVSYTGQSGAVTPLSSPFAAGKGSVCATSAPFALTQSAKPANATAGAYSPYTFTLTRADGQQYLSRVSTTIPAGLLGDIPSVTLCGEPQAATGTCTAASQIGVASVTAGAGPEPYPLSGPVYLTGPYDNAPYGLSIPVSVVAGPFNLGVVTTRATINVDPHTARVTVSTPSAGTPGALPTIVSGVPVRLKTIKVEVNRPSFIFNPTNCGPLATESTLTSTFGATQGLSSPFQVGNCSALAFKPSFKTATSAKTSKLNGASLQVSLTQPAHEANMKSVFVELPKQLPSRLTTLQKACPEATFAANPVSCRPLGSEVGTATVTTPVLPGQLTGSAYLVSHGGESFPDLDIVLEGDGVKVILTGNTKITKGITSSTFASIPDVPVTSFVLNLPVGPHSALTAIGGLCLKPLQMPTTITAQSGAVVKQSTRISVSGCGVRILSHRVVGHKLIIKLRTLGAGLIKLKGTGLPTVSRRVSKSSTVTFKLSLTRGGLKALSKARRKHRKLKISVRVAFTPKQKGQFGSAAAATVTFKR
jgi:hypothetical protein